MDGLTVYQRVESSTSISGSKTGGEPGEGQECQFKTRKTDKVRSFINKRLESAGDMLTSGFSSMQKKVVPVDMDQHWFNLLDSVDSSTSDQYYQENRQKFGDCYKEALQQYVNKRHVNKRPEEHFEYLKDYMHRGYENNKSKFSFQVQEGTKDEKLLVTIPTMPKLYDGFRKELIALLDGHGSSGSLAISLTDSFKSLGLKLRLVITDWIVTLSPPKPDEGTSINAQAEIACDGQTISSVRQPVKVDVESDEREKKVLVVNIMALYNANEEFYNLCQLLKRIADLHKRYVQGWSLPSELPNYASFQVARATEETLEKLGKPSLSSIKLDLEYKRKMFLNYISLIWDSFPSENEQGRQLISFNPEYNTEQVVGRALEILNEELELRQFDQVKLMLFRSRYDQEARDREILQSALLELQSAGNSLKGYKDYQSVAEKAPWFMNMVGECLRQGMPVSLFKLGKIKISSRFRIAWKEKLIEWGIERSDKVSSPSTPQIKR